MHDMLDKEPKAEVYDFSSQLLLDPVRLLFGYV